MGKVKRHKSTEEKYILQSIKLAEKSLKANENPFGCIIVQNNKIIAKSTNKTARFNDVSKHAEIVALQLAQKKLGKDLSSCELYSNCEPCVMCSFIIRELRIKKVVFAVYSPKMGGYSKWNVLEDSGLSEINPPFADPPNILGGILENEAKKTFEKIGWNEMFLTHSR